MLKLLTLILLTLSFSGHAATHKLLFKTKDVIWGFDFIENDKVVYTEKSGLIKLYDFKTKKHTLLAKPSMVSQKGQGGLLDIKTHPNFTSNKKIYFTYAKKVNDEHTTALAYGVLKNNKLTGIKEIFTAQALSSKGQHFGSRIVFDNNNKIYLSIGDRGTRNEAQNLNSHKGKILKLNDDGSANKDNPLKDKGLNEIWTYGHRNPQGLFMHPETKKLWSVEFGPRGGDELNLIEKGNNYGWPVITYGREYWGPKIGETHKKGMEQPIKYWKPSISPSGFTIYVSEKYPQWSSNFFLANLSSKHIRRLVMENNKVKQQETLLEKLGWRFRHVRANKEGRLFFATDHGHFGELIAENQ